MNEEKKDVMTLLLEAHRRGQRSAVETSIRTGVPLAVNIDGKNVKIMPKYKYILVPIDSEIQGVSLDDIFKL